MSGSPLRGPQWVAVELAAGCTAWEAVLDWETACADDYLLQVRAAEQQQAWDSLEATRLSRKVSRQHVVDRLRLQP
eukprot:339533-Prymnesium_polylepis.1